MLQSFDIPRLVSVYSDNFGMRWWTTAWFNDSEKAEPSVEINSELANKFYEDDFDKETWLNEYFPEQMEIYNKAMAQTKEQLLNQIQV